METKQRLNVGRTILIGLAFLSICAFWQFYDNEIPKILKNTFGMGETLTGVIMALDNVFALFLLPFFGAVSDKTRTRIGRRMPFILFGTGCAVVLLSILARLASNPVAELPFIAVLLMLLVAMGTYRSPAVSLMPDLTPAPLRSRANAIINLCGTIGGVYTLVMIKLLLKTPADGSLANYVPLATSVAALMVVAVLVLFLTIHENRLAVHDETPDEEKEIAEKTKGLSMPKDVKRSMAFLLISVALWFTAYNAVTTAFSRYVEQVWDLHNNAYADCLMVATVSAVAAYIPIGQVATRIGRKKTILFGIVLMSFCYLCASFLPSYHRFVNVLFVLIGIGWASINVNSYPMVVEMARSGQIGRYTGLYYTFSMAAQVVTPILSGFLLEHVSYRTLFPYAFLFSTAAFFTMLQVRHGDSKFQKTSKTAKA